MSAKRAGTSKHDIIKIHFCDFSPGVKPENDLFFKLISDQYRVELDVENPDYLIYSCYGYDFLKYDCVKIFFTGENIRPNFNLCDYAIGFDYIDFGDRYFRFPCYARFKEQAEKLVRTREFTTRDLEKKTSFCNFIYSTVSDPKRDIFFHRLSKYKRVDSLGKHLNNMYSGLSGRYDTNWAKSKEDVQRKYKFSITFENSSTPGYTTEKIMHAFIADTIPIYWGNALIDREFNNESFVNCHQFDNFEQVIERIAELDNDDDLYINMLNQPGFIQNEWPKAISYHELMAFFDNIFSFPLADAKRRPAYLLRDEEQLRRFIADYQVMSKLRSLVNFPQKFVYKNRKKSLLNQSE